MLWSHCARHWNLLHRGFYQKEFWRKWFSSAVCNSEQNFGIVAPFAQICCSNVAFNAQICCSNVASIYSSAASYICLSTALYNFNLYNACWLFILSTRRLFILSTFQNESTWMQLGQCSSNQRLAEKNRSHICNGNQLIKSNAGRIAAIKGRRRIV